MPRAKGGYENVDGKNRAPRQQKAGYKAHRSAEFSGWANVTIPDSKRDLFAEFESTTAFPDAVDRITHKNIRLSMVQEAGEDAFMATAFCMDESHPSAGMMVSQRSSSAVRALAKLAFCITELMPDDWTELAGSAHTDW